MGRSGPPCRWPGALLGATWLLLAAGVPTSSEVEAQEAQPPAALPQGTGYVVASISADVTPVDLATSAVGAPIALDQFPDSIAVTPDERTAYVTGGDGITPVVLGAGTTDETIPAIGSVRIVITNDGQTALVTRPDHSMVLPIDLSTNEAGAPIVFDGSPTDIALDPDGTTAWVTVPDRQRITPIDVATQSRGVPITAPFTPQDIAITASGSTAYVTTDDSTLQSVDLATRLIGDPISLSRPAFGITITPDGTRALVAHPSANTVTQVDLGSRTASQPIQVGDGPRALAISSDGGFVFVANNFSNDLTPIEMTSNAPGEPIAFSADGPTDLAIVPAARVALPPAVPVPTAPSFTG